MSPTSVSSEEALEHGGMPGGGPLGGAVRDDGIDPDLLALPAPPESRRLVTLTVMAAAVVAALALTMSLSLDMAYSLTEARPQDLGAVNELSAANVPLNRYVRLSGTPTVARAVRYSRSLVGSYRLFPLAGQSLVYVQVADRPDAMARAEFTGRIVRFADLGGRYAPVVEHLAGEGEQPVTGESLVLLADEAPGDYQWTWVIALLCAAFVALDSFFIVRWFRPVPWAQEALDALRGSGHS